MDKSEFAPIAVFVHSRLENTRIAIDALLLNAEAQFSDLYIFSDGARDRRGESEKVSDVREYIRSVSGFRSVVIYESIENKGLATSIISGVTSVLEVHETVIVLEDDLIVSSGFLRFMNQSLEEYRNSSRVLNISGYSLPIKYSENYPWDVAFGVRASSWGWATWKDRWSKVSWDVKDYAEFKRNWRMRRQFNRGGSDLCRMLDKQQRGVISSWAIRFVYHQFRFDMVDVFPVRSLVDNVGFGDSASNCTEDVNGWNVDIWDDPPATFRFPKETRLDDAIVRQFRSYNSLFARAIRVLKRVRLRLLSKTMW